MKRIAFATCDRYPALTADDQLVISAAAEKSISVAAATWNNKSVRWHEFDAVVVRSTWDYFHSLPEFRAWIDFLKREGIPLWNPPEALHWNLEKTYLKDLALKGIPIVPTAWIGRDLKSTLSEGFGRYAAEGEMNEVIVKPTVSADGFKTYRLKASDHETLQLRTAEILENSSVMVQPFLNEVVRDGEWSFLFFNKKFSHAVLKKAASEDFRVQYTHGGTAELAKPPVEWIKHAENVVQAVEWPLLYARVDMIYAQGTLLLGELEITEPALYFDKDPQAVVRFAEALSTCRPQ